MPQDIGTQVRDPSLYSYLKYCCFDSDEPFIIFGFFWLHSCSAFLSVSMKPFCLHKKKYRTVVINFKAGQPMYSHQN